MVTRTTKILIFSACVVLSASVAHAQPSPAPPMTLWRFLGIPQAFGRMNAQVFNRRGNMPRLEARPPLKSIADPRNLESPFEPVKIAAKVKQAEDAAPQKIKAVKYLADIGCGCYDKTGEVTKALKAGLEDCTEDVRRETIQAVARAARRGACAKCSQRCCCNEELIQALAKIAYERDETGCYAEPSDRVRREAIEALEICCPSDEQPEIIDDFDDRDSELGNPGNPPMPPPDNAMRGGAGFRPVATPMMNRPAPLSKIAGKIEQVERNGLIYLQVDQNATVPVGSEVDVFHKYLTGTTQVGTLEIISSTTGRAVGRLVPGTRPKRISRGDSVTGMGVLPLPTTPAAPAEDQVAVRRSGSKNSDFQIVEGLPPGPLRRLIDVTVRRVESVPPFADISLAEGGNLQGWREFLVAGDAVRVLRSSADGHAAHLGKRECPLSRRTAGRGSRTRGDWRCPDAGRRGGLLTCIAIFGCATMAMSAMSSTTDLKPSMSLRWLPENRFCSERTRSNRDRCWRSRGTDGPMRRNVLTCRCIFI